MISFVAFWPCSLAVGKNFATSGRGTRPVSILSKGFFSVFSGSNSQELIIFSVIVVFLSYYRRLYIFLILRDVTSCQFFGESISSETPDISLKLEEINDLRCLVKAHCSQDSRS